MAGRSSRVSRVLMTGPLVPFADAYSAELRRRGYTPLTTVNELRQVGRLSRWLESSGLSVAELSGARVEAFLAWQRAGSGHRSQVSRPGLLCLLGPVAADLSPAALLVRGRRRSSLPKGISRADAKALLAACDRRSLIGRRDYAVIITLLRLGLRRGELARLTLDDIDWRAGELEVRGNGREDRLPLLAPSGPIDPSTVASTVRRACRRARISEVGSHRLRHTTACEMVQAGVPIVRIGQVLRHQSLHTTAIYARADIEQLRQLAAPWPTAGTGGAR